MRHKMITLCPTSYEIASKRPNFSKEIRKYLMNAETTDNLRQEINHLEEELDAREQLIDDIIAGKKVWVKNKGWVKNMYNEVE
tara:strand:+ start:142 stop:390 length:249 start_codon:yes stop_codon:yes gene_type:complete